MKTYIFTKAGSDKRGYNLSINVYRVINNVPKLLGRGDYQTAGYRGTRGEVHKIIADKEGYSLKGYHIDRKDVQIIEL